jgi:Neurotransmitter-gated ion-channel ligand binding domain
MRTELSPLLVGALLIGSLAFAAPPGPSPTATRPAAPVDQTRLLAPRPGDGPVVVRTSFWLRDVNDIDDSAETFHFSGILRLEWRDPRQAFDPVQAGVAEKLYQGAYQFDELAPSWYPQVILANQSGLFDTHAVLLRVRPDGTQTLYQSVDAIAESDLDLRRLPFDAQTLRAVFEVLGMDASAVRLEVDPDAAESFSPDARVPQWDLGHIGMHAEERSASELGHGLRVSQAVLSVDVTRESLFMLRLIVIPLALIVAMSWAVFWMDRSSVGDRINVSFVGILTAVAYQLVVADLMPDVAYLTLLHAFLNLSFGMMCATVVINLLVGAYDKAGRPEVGDRIDLRSRWAFPLVYAGLLLALGISSRLMG